MTRACTYKANEDNSWPGPLPRGTPLYTPCLHFTPVHLIHCNGTTQVITLMIMSFDGDKQRQKSKLQMKQTCTYRKASSFVRRQSDAAGSNSSVGLKPSISKDVNLINKSRLNRGSDALTPDHMMESYSSDSSMSECNFPP